MSRTDNPRPVNQILNTLRGEHFRHSQNLRGSRTYLASSLDNLSRSLPADLVGLEYTSEDVPLAKDENDSQSASRKCSGPSPPKSWSLKSPKDFHDTAEWRQEALSLIFNHSKPPYLPPAAVPRLTLLCLRKIMSNFTATELAQDVVQFIPSHLRLDLLRYTAVKAPLSNPKLYALLDEDGFVNGELIVVGPSGSVTDHFRHTTSINRRSSRQEEWEVEEWLPEPLHTVILLSTHLSIPAFLTFPPTLTHLALLNLPSAVPLHRLPPLCPHIVILDLSYNTWLKSASAEKVLDRIDWGRWSQLKVLGFRECYIPAGMIIKVNKGRWDDVEVVQ